MATQRSGGKAGRKKELCELNYVARENNIKGGESAGLIHHMMDSTFPFANAVVF